MSKKAGHLLAFRYQLIKIDEFQEDEDDEWEYFTENELSDSEIEDDH